MPENNPIFGDPTGLVESFKELTNTLKFTSESFSTAFENMEGGALALNKQFGQGRQRIHELKLAVADATPVVYRLGGTLGEAVETTRAISEATRRNVIASTEEIGKLFAANELLKGTGIGTKELVEGFQDIGTQFSQVGEQLEKSFNYIQSVGVNASQVMGKVMENMSQMNRFNFQDGVQGLTRMATQATLMKFDMGQVFTLADRALDPQGAIELSSAFQRLGIAAGGLTDPFELMYKSLNDPEGLQNSLVEMTKQFTYFDEKTKSFKISPAGMLQLRELQNQTGISAAEMSKLALNTADLDKKLSTLRPSLQFENEEDKMYLANIAKMDKGGEYTVDIINKQGQKETQKLQDLTQEQLDVLIAQEKDRPKDLEDIQRAQLSNFEVMRGDLHAIRNKLLGGVVTAPKVSFLAEDIGTLGKIVTSTLNKNVDQNKIRGKVDETVGNVKDILTKMAKGESTGFDFEKLKRATEGVFNFEKLKDEIMKLGKEMSGQIPQKIKDRYDIPFDLSKFFQSEQSTKSDEDPQAPKGYKGAQFDPQAPRGYKGTQFDPQAPKGYKNTQTDPQAPNWYKNPFTTSTPVSQMDVENLNVANRSLDELLKSMYHREQQLPTQPNTIPNKQDLVANTLNVENLNIGNKSLADLLNTMNNKSQQLPTQPNTIPNKQDLVASEINISNNSLNDLIAIMANKPQPQQLTQNNNLSNKQDLVANAINVENINISNTSLNDLIAGMANKLQPLQQPNNNISNKDYTSANIINPDNINVANKSFGDMIQSITNKSRDLFVENIKSNTTSTENLAQRAVTVDSKSVDKSVTHKHVFEGSITWKIDAPSEIDTKRFYAMIDQQQFKDAFTKIVVDKFKETENSIQNNMS